MQQLTSLLLAPFGSGFYGDGFGAVEICDVYSPPDMIVEKPELPLPIISLSAGDLADLYRQAASALRGSGTTVAPRLPIDLPDLIQALDHAASELEAVQCCERRFREP